MKIMVIGSTNIDHNYTVDQFVKPGETKSVLAYHVDAGGKGLNQAIAIAKSGLDTHFAGIIGHDGLFLKEELEKYNIHTDQMKVSDSANGHAIIQIEESGQNCILIYPGTNGEFTEAQIDAWLDTLQEGDVVVTQNETNLVPYLISKAKEKGIRVGFNASPITEELKSYPIGDVKWLFVNEVEGELLSGHKEPEKIIAWFQEKYPETELILTLGENGACWSENGNIHFQEANKVNVADTTAAGDTFSGYFLRGVLDPIEGITPLKLATYASSIAITIKGAAVSVPSVTEVLEKIKNAE